MTHERSWTQPELAYFAGIIDGEGSFSLKRHLKSHRYGCALAVGNTDLRMLDWIQSRFGGIVAAEKRANTRHKPIWRWVANSDDLETIIRSILPYLVCKKDRAELILAYRATLSPRVNSKRSTYDIQPHIQQERLKIHSALSLLNKRGAA